MKNIVIKIGELIINARLNGSATAGKIWDALPIKSFVSRWGEEIYFQIPVKAKLEEGFARETVKLGDMAFWPEGSCFCLFFGLTPISKAGEIRPASKVNVIGEIEGDLKILKSVKDDETVVIEELRE